jgi:hypothetical protein
MKFRNLRAEEIDVRVGNCFSWGYTLLLYKDARCDMNILDETLGVGNWQRDHKEVKGNLYCGVAIWDNEKSQWIWKWDCGVESNTEKEKGEASDSFKRACVNLGIGRELYTSPQIKISCEMEANGKGYNLPQSEKNRRFKVKEIQYNDNNEIIKLVIVDNKNVQVFPANSVQNIPNKEIEEIPVALKCSNCGIDIKDNVAKFSKSKFGRELCFDCQKKANTEPVPEIEC